MGEQKPEATLPFETTTISTFELPWRIAFLPDGRMLVTEKIGPIWLVSADGREDRAARRHTRRLLAGPERHAGGLPLAHTTPPTRRIYITYIEPGDYGGGQALARAKLNLGREPRLENFEVIWRQMPRGKGGQAGGQIAFSPDGQYSVHDGRRPPAHDSGPGPEPARRQDPALDARRQARPWQSQLRQDRCRHDSADRSADATPKLPRPRR